MSTAVLSSPMFDYGEILLRNTSVPKSKDLYGHTNAHAPLRRSYTSLMTSFIEHHRKLDRTASEPTSRYKTELCRPFEESGACKYGDKCQFAHGYSELRNLARHPKYKTELCRTFHTIGFCPYGPRCHFIHNVEEARIHNQMVSAQLGSAQPNILALNPTLSAQATILETTTTPCHAQMAPLMRTNSLNLATSPTYPPQVLFRTNSLGAQHSLATKPSLLAKPSPLNLSTTFSLGSNAESISPSSSLSQSPTNSMSSFFNEEQQRPGPFARPFGQDYGRSPSSRSSSPNSDTRLPVFNRISKTLEDFDHLHI